MRPKLLHAIACAVGQGLSDWICRKWNETSNDIVEEPTGTDEEQEILASIRGNEIRIVITEIPQDVATK